MSARITVAVPTFNGADYLRETLQSLQAQTCSDFQLICIDDASRDDSAAIAESMGVLVHRNPSRLGLAANWNRAVALAAGSAYLVIAHQDDVYHPSFLEKTARLLDNHDRAFIAHTQVMYVDERGEPFVTPASSYKESFWPEGEVYERGGDQELTRLLRGNYIICPAVMFRCEAMKTIGPFAPRFEFVTDWEYWIRGVRAGYTVAGIAEKLLHWRRHGSTATARQAVSLRRFEEERSLLEEQGAKLTALRHTLVDEFFARLAASDRRGAAAVADCAAGPLPWTAATMRIAAAAGAPAARAFQAAARTWLAVSLGRRHRS